MRRVLTFVKNIPWPDLRLPLMKLDGYTQQLSALLPVRYSFLVACFFGGLLALFSMVGFGVGFLTFLFFFGLVAVGMHDLRQTRSAVLRNYPVIGHLRFLFEYIRPEIRQYFIESDSEAAPFSRAQRSLVYRRAKGAQDIQPFGTHRVASRLRMDQPFDAAQQGRLA
jgi:hypothetical protein